MIVLDTDVLIDVLDRRAPSFAFVARLRADGETLGAISLSVAELLRGVAPGTTGAHRAARLATALHEVPFGPRAARRFGTIMHTFDRAGTTMPVVDGLIAAATLESGGRLVTRNARHFGRVSGLELLRPG